MKLKLKARVMEPKTAVREATQRTSSTTSQTTTIITTRIII